MCNIFTCGSMMLHANGTKCANITDWKVKSLCLDPDSNLRLLRLSTILSHIEE